MEFQSLLPLFEKAELHCVDELAFTLFANLKSESTPLKNMLNPTVCDKKFLPFLAYENNVDFWNDDLTEQQKRDLIIFSKQLKRKKGTIWAIEKVFEALNLQATVQEWFDYNGSPYHFKIKLTLLSEVTAERIIKLRALVQEYKNARSNLEELLVSTDLQCSVPMVGIGIYAKIKVTLYPATEI